MQAAMRSVDLIMKKWRVHAPVVGQLNHAGQVPSWIGVPPVSTRARLTGHDHIVIREET
jgi:hypothetical protein